MLKVKKFKKTSEQDKKILIKMKMMQEANLIFESVNWAEKQIKEKIDEITHAQENFLIAEEEILRKQLKGLLKSLKGEMKEMDKFLAKYEKVIEAAKKGEF